MEEHLSARLERKAGLPGLIKGLADRLSGSDLNSLLLEVYGENDYYKGIQFKLYAHTEERVWEIADGGFVDWTQQLLGNRKERLLVSGFGLEWLYKIGAGQK
ncbi:MAG TPA: hypothetical protein VGS79_26800 [Puia sp.]|nr:hypothetical protein [Puia sp.]